MPFMQIINFLNDFLSNKKSQTHRKKKVRHSEIKWSFAHKLKSQIKSELRSHGPTFGHFYIMTNDNRELNSCVCKCGSITCRNIHIHQFRNQILDNNDQFSYSILHHNSLRVPNSRSIVVDRCCDNCLHFHCAKCKEQFSIMKSQNFSKKKFIFGFNTDCLSHLEPTDCNEVVIIPDFPIALKSFVCLSKDQKTIEKVDNTIEKVNNIEIMIDNINKSSHFLNTSSDENDEILSFDSDEDIMFGKDQTDLIIGKYNEASISSFNERSHLLNYSIQNIENDEDDEILSFDFNEKYLFGKDQIDLIIGKYNEASISSFKQNYSTL